MPMWSPRQESWSGLPFPPPGHLPDPGTEPASPALTGRFFIDWATMREAQMRFLLSKHPFPFPDIHERSLPLWALMVALVCDLHGPQMEHSTISLSLHPREFLPCSSGSFWPPWEKHTWEVQPWSLHPGVNTGHTSRAATPAGLQNKQRSAEAEGHNDADASQWLIQWQTNVVRCLKMIFPHNCHVLALGTMAETQKWFSKQCQCSSCSEKSKRSLI